MDSRAYSGQTVKESDIVLSTRVRLARNLNKVPFVWRMNISQAEDVKQRVQRAVEHCSRGISAGLNRTELENLTKAERRAMSERHLISDELVENCTGRELYLSPDETVVISVNDEDHVRVQSFAKGLELSRAYSIASALDDALNSSLRFAFDKKLGYLTPNPMNLGNAMKASVLLHLPALEMSGRTTSLQTQLARLGLTLKGVYREGMRTVGSLYELANQVSLGITEQQAIENLQSITLQLCEKEREARSLLREDIHINDKVSRAYGVLKTAKLIELNEAIELLSTVRLGATLGLLGDVQSDIDRLFTEIQPGTLSVNIDNEEDRARAELLNSSL